LALNASAKSGDTLELVATRVTPGVVMTKLASEGAALTGSARPNLSPTGQLISFLLTGQPAARPATLAGNQPLLNTPSPSMPGANPAANANIGSAAGASAASSAHIGASTQLVPLLRQALSQSGLFYEAHQTQWLAGKTDLAALLREPQAQAGRMPSGQTMPGTANPASANPASPNSPATSGSPASGTANTANTGTASRVTQAPVNAAAQALSRNEEPVARLNSASTQYSDNALRGSPVAERLLPIVHQQLEALASQQYVWHGMAWPGQAFEWIIEDPGGEERASDEETGQEWNTTLRLSLPRLGGVEAHICLTAGGVALRLRVDDQSAAARLEARRDELAEALEAADVPLTGMVVEHADES
jgi:hypothetical protein